MTNTVRKKSNSEKQTPQTTSQKKTTAKPKSSSSIPVTSSKKPKSSAEITILKAKTVLTLDLARHCGWAYVNQTCTQHTFPCVVSCGTIDIGAHTIKRWINLESEIKALFQKYSPELILIEENFIFKNVRTTAVLNQLRGAVLLLAALHNVKVDYVDNNSAKKWILGGTKYWDPALSKYVGVTKDMMLTAVKQALCSESAVPQNDDAADAVALALTYYEAPITQVALARKPKPT